MRLSKHFRKQCKTEKLFFALFSFFAILKYEKQIKYIIGSGIRWNEKLIN